MGPSYRHGVTVANEHGGLHLQYGDFAGAPFKSTRSVSARETVR